jgi:hypothetical protein
MIKNKIILMICISVIFYNKLFKIKTMIISRGLYMEKKTISTMLLLLNVN